jgi:hypothetical protein
LGKQKPAERRGRRVKRCRGFFKVQATGAGPIFASAAAKLRIRQASKSFFLNGKTAKAGVEFMLLTTLIIACASARARVTYLKRGGKSDV